MFHTTHWTLLIDIRTPGDRAQAALEALCKAYHRPVLAYLRRNGHTRDDAEDLAQGFFAQLIERRSFERADRERGRFRSYLLGALKHYLAHVREAQATYKRGGDVVRVSGDLIEEHDAALLATSKSPEDSFDCAWALTVIDRALRRVQAEAEQAGKRVLFETLREYLIEAAERSEYSDAAARLDMRPNTVAVVVKRLRARLREMIEAELRDTVGNEADLAAEMTLLRRILREG